MPPRQAEEGHVVRCRSGDSEVASEVELEVLAGLPGEAEVELALPPEARFRGDPGGQFDALRAGEEVRDTVTYRMTDGAATDTATITFTIRGVNDRPDAADDAYDTDEDTLLTVPAPGALTNDRDPDRGTTLTIDQVEDVRLAVDEAVSQLILVAPGSQITCEFSAQPGELGLLAWSDAAVNLRFDTGSFGWTVMRALVDSLEDASTPDGPALALRIARQEAVQA